MTPRVRTPLAVAACTALIAVSVWVGVQGAGILGSPALLAASAIIFVAMFALWRCASTRNLMAVALVAGLLARVAFAWYPASDDVARYLWEGRVQNAGFDPYVTAPASPALKHLRDSNWESVNHKEFTTIYWPAAQVLFRAVAYSGTGVAGAKTLLAVFDALTLLMILLILRTRRLPVRNALLYWLNPLVLVFVTGEAHMEIIPVALVTAAVLCHITGRSRLAFALLGTAAMCKLTALIALPALVDRRSIRHLWCIVLPLALFALFPHGALGALGVPFRFASEFSHNGLVVSFLTLTGLPNASLLSMLIGAIALGIVLLVTPDPIRAARNCIAVMLLCLPTVHPWYFLAITPLVCVWPSPAWLALHLTSIPLAFFFVQHVHPVWHRTTLLLTIEYAPFLATALIAFAARSRTPRRSPPPLPSLSVVVPVLNERDTIGPCVAAIRASSPEAQVVVSDGGSNDGTLEMVRGLNGVTVMQSNKGRGIQVRTGVDACTGDVVAIVHADTRVLPGSLERLRRHMAAHPGLCGGAFAVRYDSPFMRFRLTELLNNVRAALFGISFGDQVQFFRRAAVPDPIPATLLMEDVELSMRMKGAGEVCLLAEGAVSSARRWRTHGFASNFARVVSLTSLYLLMRRAGLLSSDCGEFHRWYYGR